MRVRYVRSWTAGAVALAILGAFGGAIARTRADEDVAGSERVLVRTGRVTLLAHRDAESWDRATLDFRLGVRNDGRTRAVVDLLYGRGDRFSVHAAVTPGTEGRSVILDLGEMDWAEIGDIPRLPDMARGLTTSAPVRSGHVYVVRRETQGRDDIALVRVDALVPDESCDLSYLLVARDPPSEAATFSLPDTTRAGLVSRLRAALDWTDRTRDDPRVLPEQGPYLLQLRTGDQKGHVSRVGLGASLRRGVDRWSDGPMDMGTPPRPGDVAVAHVTPGTIPRDRALLVERVEVMLQASGDDQGPGGAAVVLGRRELLRRVDSSEVVRGVFEGREVLERQEFGPALLAASTSLVEARIHGRLIPKDDLPSVVVVPLTPRGEQGLPATGRGPWLDKPEGTLELAYLGDASGRRDEPTELDLRHLGRIPPDLILEIREIGYEGRGPFELRLPTTRIRRPEPASPVRRGLWVGRQVVRPGFEREVRLRVWPGGNVRVMLRGVFKRSPTPTLGPYRE